jgi:hypothetical protein
LLCVYQGRTVVGTVELTTSLLARDLGFQKVLKEASIPLGSADYTDFGNRPLVRTALSAHAANDLAYMQQGRSATYADKKYTFVPVAPQEMHIGQLPAVAYGFTGYDREGGVLERWLTYAAFDNKVLYLFSMSYADGVPEGFVSDSELVRFEPYLRQILAQLRLPAGEDWHSPGAELPQGPLLVVQRPDDSIQYVTLDGLSAVLVAEAPSSLLPAGYSGVPFGGTPMGDGPIVYIRQWGGDAFYALDTLVGQLYLLDFVPLNVPVAVRPLTEGLWSGDAPPFSLAWGELSAADTATARLYLSSPDGSQIVQVLEETYEASELPAEFVPWRWNEKGQLYYTRQPVGAMAGFPPFVGAANLWLFDLRSGGSVELVSDAVTGGQLCLDAIYIDDRRVAHHCNEGGYAILDLESDETTPVRLPKEVTSDMQLGTARFSPDGSRIAFAAMRGGHGQIEETRGYIAVSDNLSLSGSSHVIVSSQPGEWFTVLGWLSNDRLVLHSYSADPSGQHWPAVWTVRADGSGLVKLAEGTFLSGRWHLALF